MCLIITVVMAAAFSVLYAAFKKTGRFVKSFSLAALMFWSAALMWSVDGINAVLHGEAFFDLSREDLVLGGIIAVLGTCVFLISMLIEVRRLNQYNSQHE
ncbi:hypothetical protein [Treponema sp.]|uniref:hypothetical protein n=1 Tax=Treponema sp. TaxID=166 RepID=UPI0025797E94|nr:hypothetical protein [Treponema sp.]MBE6354817.1 hypothetical protein [Treponema sp.]